MRKTKKRGLAALLTLSLLFGTSAGAAAAFTPTQSDALADTAAYLQHTVTAPQIGSIGGEWAVIGLARSGVAVPETYFQHYDSAVRAEVQAKSGVLSTTKYTEYSRVILALTAIGKDPTNVAGYNLLTPLGDYDKTVWQGINGPIWALIALDSGNYTMPQNPTAAKQATRQMYVDNIIAAQNADGGWSLSGDTSDPDMTGMALQALAKYQGQSKVKTATDKALTRLSQMQDADGGYSSWGTTNSESVVQVLVALGELGIAADDVRFVKNGKSALDNLMTFYTKGGGFRHTSTGDGSSAMATEQAMYALVSAQRQSSGKNSLYRMDDAITIANTGSTEPGKGLPGKNAAVTAQSIKTPGVTFDDIRTHANRAAIEALAARGIINGKSPSAFDPDATMTRAEFAAIVVRGLGLTPKANTTFADVPSNAWYAPYIGTANSFGIVNGVSATSFAPSGTITRQQAAAMVARAATLCGMDTAMTDAAVRDMLAQFTDYVKADSWARPSLAFCYSNGILAQADLAIRPKEAARRCEIAQMLYQMLSAAKLL